MFWKTRMTASKTRTHTFHRCGWFSWPFPTFPGLSWPFLLFLGLSWPFPTFHDFFVPSKPLLIFPDNPFPVVQLSSRSTTANLKCHVVRLEQDAASHPYRCDDPQRLHIYFGADERGQWILNLDLRDRGFSCHIPPQLEDLGGRLHGPVEGQLHGAVGGQYSYHSKIFLPL